MTTPSSSSFTSAPQDWMLVVDDEAEICEFLVEGLSDDKLAVVAANDGKAALAAISQRPTPPLVVMMDVLMPGGLDGLSLARKLKDKLARTKIVLMSGHLSDDSWWPADLREVVFLPKPFRIAQVAELVEAARSEFRGKA